METLSRVLYEEKRVFSFRTLRDALKYLGYGAVTIKHSIAYIFMLLLVLFPIASFFLDIKLEFLAFAMALFWVISSVVLSMTDLEEKGFTLYFLPVKFSTYTELFPAKVTRLILRDLAGTQSQNEIHEALLKHNVDKKALVLVEGIKRKSQDL